MTVDFEQELDDRIRASAIEADMVAGVKRTPEDLQWYMNRKTAELTSNPTWRHRETETVYHVVGAGLASTGQGTLALMVHYRPVDDHGGIMGVTFERQEHKFKERFEQVVRRTVWDVA